MSARRPGWLLRRAEAAVLARWTKLARIVDDLDHAEHASLSEEAMRLRAPLDTVMAASAPRTLPEDVFTPQPDWVWRPLALRAPLLVPGHVGVPSGTRLGGDTALFHDCPQGEIVLRQDRPPSAVKAGLFTLVLDVMRFSGSYVSFAFDLAAANVRQIDGTRIVTVDIVIGGEPAPAFVTRLNIRHGPNVMSVERRARDAGERCRAEFDLGQSGFDALAVTAAWVDLIFDPVAYSQVRIEDFLVRSHPRGVL